MTERVEPEDDPEFLKELEPFITAGPKEVAQAMALITCYGGIDGAHHKDWVMDQVVRKLTGDKYDEFVEYACDGEDGPDTYSWFEEACPP